MCCVLNSLALLSVDKTGEFSLTDMTQLQTIEGEERRTQEAALLSESENNVKRSGHVRFEHPALTSHGGAIDISQGNFDIPQELDGYDPTARYLRTVG